MLGPGYMAAQGGGACSVHGCPGVWGDFWSLRPPQPAGDLCDDHSECQTKCCLSLNQISPPRCVPRTGILAYCLPLVSPRGQVMQLVDRGLCLQGLVGVPFQPEAAHLPPGEWPQCLCPEAGSADIHWGHNGVHRCVKDPMETGAGMLGEGHQRLVGWGGPWDQQHLGTGDSEAAATSGLEA